MALSSKTLAALCALHGSNNITMEQLCDFLSDRCRQLETELEERRTPSPDNKALTEIKTCDLVRELEKREGVETHNAEPYKDLSVSVNGPAVVLAVID